MQSQTGQDTQSNTKFIILYLFKCLDRKKLYFRVEVRCQIHTCIPVPKKAKYKKPLAIIPVLNFISEEFFFIFIFKIKVIQKTRSCTRSVNRCRIGPSSESESARRPERENCWNRWSKSSQTCTEMRLVKDLLGRNEVNLTSFSC